MPTILVPIDGSSYSEAALPESAAQSEDERRDCGALLARAARRFDGRPVQRRLDQGGDPVAGILTAVREEQADLIVMSTHGRSGLSATVQGSVAAEVVRAGVAPVTLVHPPES